MSASVAHEYPCILRYHWHMKAGIKNIREKHQGSISILKNGK